MGRARFYADENVPAYLVEYLREQGFHTDYAPELGLAGRDDAFQLQEAKRRKAIVLSRDKDFLDHRKHPFQHLRNTSVVVLRSNDETGEKLSFGYVLVNLLGQVGASGNKNLFGLKIELNGPKMIFHAEIGGRIRTDSVDTSKPRYDKTLFEDAQEA